MKFGEWCDLRGKEPTMGNVDEFVAELTRERQEFCDSAHWNTLQAEEQRIRAEQAERELDEAHVILDGAFADRAKDSPCAKCRDHGVGYRAAALIEQAERELAAAKEALRKCLQLLRDNCDTKYGGPIFDGF